MPALLGGEEHDDVWVTASEMDVLVELAMGGLITRNEMRDRIPITLAVEDFTLTFQFPFPFRVARDIGLRYDPWRGYGQVVR